MSIEFKEAAFVYRLPAGKEVPALAPVSFSVKKGDFVAVIGANGSGKSTLARLANGLLKPTSGEVLIDGRSTFDLSRAEAARRVGLVFQNPDNQLIATIVEDDTAFGPENLGLPPAEIRKRVDEALTTVGMSEYRLYDPHNLSSGQKQKVAVAGILAMRPSYIVLDEPTSMLDPSGRRGVLESLMSLRCRSAVGVVYITHSTKEAALSDNVIVLKDGRILAAGSPRKILTDVDLMRKACLSLTEAGRVAAGLAAAGLDIPGGILTIEEMAAAICSLV